MRLTKRLRVKAEVFILIGIVRLRRMLAGSSLIQFLLILSERDQKIAPWCNVEGSRKERKSTSRDWQKQLLVLKRV